MTQFLLAIQLHVFLLHFEWSGDSGDGGVGGVGVCDILCVMIPGVWIELF